MSTPTFEVSYRTIINSVNAVGELMQVPMPAKTAFNLRKIANQINEISTDLQEASKKRAEELMPEDDKEISEKNKARFEEEMEELLDSEVTITGEKISINDLGMANVKPVTLFALDWLVVG